MPLPFGLLTGKFDNGVENDFTAIIELVQQQG